MMKIPMDCPERDDELCLARRMLGKESPEAVLSAGAVRPVLSAGEIGALRDSMEAITVREELLGYIVDIVRRTRSHESVLVGAGPRATQAILLSCRAQAAVSGRDFVTPDDVKDMTLPALTHRLILRPELEVEGLTVPEVIRRILVEVPVPR